MIASRLSELQEAHRLNIETERRLEYLREQQEQLQNERTRLQQHREVLYQQRITLRQLHNNLEVLQTEADDTYNTLQSLEDSRPQPQLQQQEQQGQESVTSPLTLQNEEASQEQPITPQIDTQGENLDQSTSGSTITEIERIKNRIDRLVGRLRNLNVNLNEDELANELVIVQENVNDDPIRISEETPHVDQIESTPRESNTDERGATAASQTRAKDVCERAKELREKMYAMALIRENDIEEAKKSIDKIKQTIEEDNGMINLLSERFPSLEIGSDAYQETTLRKTRIQNNIELLKSKEELVSKLLSERETLLADSEEIERSTSQLEGLNQILSDQEFLSEALEGMNQLDETEDS